MVVFLCSSCSSTPPAPSGDPRIARMARSGRKAYSRGEFKLAVRLYHQALLRAREMDDAGEIGTNAYNLAACYLEEGEAKRAQELLREARQAFLRQGSVPTDMVLLEARAAFLLDRTEEARRLIKELPLEGDAAAQPAIQAQLALFRARLDIAARDEENAAKNLTIAREILPETGNVFLEGDYSGLEGELLLLRGSNGDAGAAFDRQAGLLRESARYRSMARALTRAGEAYLLAGDSCLAGDRFFRSARSLYARGDIPAALEVIQLAVGAAEECDDPELPAEIRRLFREIRQDAEIANNQMNISGRYSSNNIN